MTQFDARMGFAPALLCIEEEPLKKTAPVAALKPHPKQKEFDAFAKGNHIAGMIAGVSVGVDLASMVAQDISCSISEYMTRYDAGHAIHDELTFHTYGQDRTNIFRGANDKENKTATEIQMKIREAEQRMLRSVLDNMSISRPMPAPSGLSMLMDAERQWEKGVRHALNASAGTAALLSGVTPGNDGWFDGPPPCPGWWEASKSKHEGHYRYWNGSGLWSVHAVSRDGNCSNLNPVYDAYNRSAEVRWRPFTPPWESTKTLVMEKGRPVLYMPSEKDPLCQVRIKESFSSSSAYDRSAKLRMLTKEKCDVAAARLDAAINGKPIESTDFWANLDKASHLGGSPFERFKAARASELSPKTPGSDRRQAAGAVRRDAEVQAYPPDAILDLRPGQG